MNIQKDPREVIIRPVISERSYDMMEEGKYTFEVAKNSNKIEIKKAVESIFNVKVVSVNVSNAKPKPKRVRYVPGHTKTWKKAIVKLRQGDKIELFGNAQ